MNDWVKSLVIGFLQPYLYEQVNDVRQRVKRTNPAWFPEAGGIVVQPGDELPFFKALLKALLYVIRHGK